MPITAGVMSRGIKTEALTIPRPRNSWFNIRARITVRKNRKIDLHSCPLLNFLADFDIGFRRRPEGSGKFTVAPKSSADSVTAATSSAADARGIERTAEGANDIRQSANSRTLKSNRASSLGNHRPSGGSLVHRGKNCSSELLGNV